MITRSRSRALASRANAESASAGNADRVVSRNASNFIRHHRTSGANERVVEMTSLRLSKTRQLMNTERKLVRSCEHVILLNDKIRGLTKRYKSARAEGFKSFRYNLRIRLAAVEGVRNMFYEYARDRAEEIAELRKELYDQNVHIVTASDPEESDNEYEVADEPEEEDMEADDGTDN